jgi:hypothetical protein
LASRQGVKPGDGPDSGSVGNSMIMQQECYLHLFDGEPIPVLETFDQYPIGAFS